MPAASSTTAPSTSGRRRIFGFATAIARLWLKRHRARRQLADLHDDQLRDAGLDRFAVHAEADKPFWRP